MTSPVAALLQHRLATDAAAPLITYYDDATGERTELSATTLANWVAKTANLLQDGLDLEPGHRIAVLLPPHWQTAAILLAAWTLGATVMAPVGGDPEVALWVATEDGLGDLLDPDAEERFGQLMGVSLHPMGAPMQLRAAGVTDYAGEVRIYGDDFHAYLPPDPEAPALVAGSLTLSTTALASAAHALAARMGLAAGDRVLVDAALAAEAGPVAWLLAPLAAGASIVLCAHPDPARLEDRAAAERVTVTLGPQVPGVRPAGG